MTNHRSSSPRAGFTLAEVLVVLTLGTTVAIIAVSCLEQTFRLSHELREATERERSFRSLVRDFRSDVHQASQSSVIDGSELSLLNAEEVIRYTLVNHSEAVQLVREIRRDDGVFARQSYRLEPGRIVRFAKDDEDASVTLTLESSAGSGHASGIDRQVIARMARRDRAWGAEMEESS